ncbi:hypothetical protein ACSQ67_011685 [Phaseolus vulgaris]
MQFPDFFTSAAAPETSYPSLGPSCWYFNAYKPPNCLQPGSLHSIQLASSDTPVQTSLQYSPPFPLTNMTFHVHHWRLQL